MTNTNSLIERLRCPWGAHPANANRDWHCYKCEAADALEELQNDLQDSFTEKGGLVDKIDRLQAELAEAQKETEEQCRLLGMSGSREAKLLTELAEEKRMKDAAVKVGKDFEDAWRELKDKYQGEKRAVEFLTVSLAKSQSYVFDWKKKFEAAREVAIKNWEMWCREYERSADAKKYSEFEIVRESASSVDAEIEAKMKEKNS